LDGFATVAEYAEQMPLLNQKFLCITDHGVMGAVPQQIAECDKHNLFPIFGSELYVNHMQPEVETRYDSAEFRKNLPENMQKRFDKSSHLTAIAYTDEGYSNLVRITSWGWIHGYYRKPRVNHDVLMRHKEGIVFLSGCANSEIANAIVWGGEEAGWAMLEKYMAMFSPHFYLEVMMIDYPGQKPYNEFLLRAHDKYSIPLVLTQDCHYCAQEHSYNQRLMLMQQNHRTIQEINAMIEADETQDLFELQDTNLWLKSEDELNTKWEQSYSDNIDYELYKMAKANTVKIAQFAKGVELNREIKLPKVPNAEAMLWDETLKGFKSRKCPATKQYAARIREEYDLVCEKGFASYFLIQKMMTDEARRKGPEILGFGDGSECVGPGRGCLHPSTPVRLTCGRVLPISEIQEGDYVVDADGHQRIVEKTMIYPLENETLLRIKTYFGDSSGVALTSDHKVFAEKMVRPAAWDTWAESTRKSRKSYVDPRGECGWVRADELTVGDWCFVPIPKVESWTEYVVDLSQFSGESLQNGKKLHHDANFVYHECNSKSGGRSIRCGERLWTLTKQWAWVLGIFVGDGWTRTKDAGQVGFCANHDEWHLDDVHRLFESIGIDSTLIERQNGKNVDQLIVRSIYFERLFNWLHPGYQHEASTKHVPDCIMNAPLDIVASYLSGYFMADGHEDDNKVKFESVSPVLAEQVRFLLLRLGIPSSLSVDNRTDDREEFSNRKTSYIVTCPLDKRLGASRDSECRYVWHPVDGGIMLRIREITEIEGSEYVCDLQVAESHNYLTSSFIVHNSACGSLVAYCLRLHDVEPIIHDLRFSRFLSPARGGRQLRIRHSLQPIPHAEVG